MALRSLFTSIRCEFEHLASRTTYAYDQSFFIKTVDYTFGLDEISQTVTENATTTTHVFGHDGHGSVRVLYDLAQAADELIQQLLTFAAHGQTLAVHSSSGTIQATTAVLSSLGYSGEFFDAAAQQQYLRASFYNPANGRFNRLDPFAGNMQDPQSLHKYAYVHGDPIDGVDPTGEFLGSLAIGTLGSTGINTRKSSGDTAAGSEAGLAIWAATVKHSLNLLTYFNLFTNLSAKLFRLQGPLSGAIATTYARHGAYGSTGVGLFYTKLFDDGYEFLEDGGMREASSKARNYWMFERAIADFPS